mmetsp:Transcript_14292/g.43932  ORF Transcript_14292/g.43932 Transcript_14292/m.43932 type:complete len:244 (+) Transcript_14292:174-905(+)
MVWRGVARPRCPSIRHVIADHNSTRTRVAKAALEHGSDRQTIHMPSVKNNSAPHPSCPLRSNSRSYFDPAAMVCSQACNCVSGLSRTFPCLRRKATRGRRISPPQVATGVSVESMPMPPRPTAVSSHVMSGHMPPPRQVSGFKDAFVTVELPMELRPAVKEGKPAKISRGNTSPARPEGCWTQLSDRREEHRTHTRSIPPLSTRWWLRGSQSMPAVPQHGVRAAAMRRLASMGYISGMHTPGE